MSSEVYVIGGMCLGGKCPGSICPWGKCPWCSESRLKGEVRQ